MYCSSLLVFETDILPQRLPCESSNLLQLAQSTALSMLDPATRFSLTVCLLYMRLGGDLCTDCVTD